jgi:cell division protein FtsI (penicillin-binding protein 3)
VQNRKHVFRSSLVFLTLIFCFGLFSVKLVLIQVFRSEHLARLAEKQHKHVIEIEPVRGNIYDRKQRLLAFNVSVYSLFANPRHMASADKVKAVNQLSVLLNLDPERIEERLSRKKYFVWIKRKLSPELVKPIKDLKIPGLGFRKESKRYYPNAHLGAHVIGFAGMDNDGLTGIEAYQNDVLKGEPGQELVFQDARHQELLLGDNMIFPKDGKNLVLTIDETIQFIAERSLNKAYEEHNAKGASIIVMDVRTGEILALANRPTYNLEKVSQSSVESRTNRAIHYVYEPGSVFKVFTAAAALEEKAFDEDDVIFCEQGEYRIANHILHDHHPYGDLSFRDVITFSSNIGTTKVAQKLGPNAIYQYGKKFRFGKKTGIDLPGEIRGYLKHPARWSRTTIGAIPIGHEILVTPLQLVTAVAAVANQGVMMKPFVLKQIKDTRGQVIQSFEPRIVSRVISPDTAARVGAIMQRVVDEGTGRRAQIDGIAVAGKTGTAQKVVDGRYSHEKFCASFLGFAPVDDPQIAVVVAFDEPHPQYFGGTVAAPVFREVVENTLRYLQTSEQ